MSRVVLIRHENGPVDDRVYSFLEQNNIASCTRRPFLGENLGEVDDTVSACVIFGGPFNVFEEKKHPFLLAENKWIEGCLQQGVPLLGICQGAQSISHVLGAKAGPLDSNQHEFGYYPIKPTTAGETYFPAELHVGQFHFHEFQIPDGGERLAYSEEFAQQAMKYGDNTFGFQFHAEVVPAGFKRWQQLEGNYFGKPGAQTLEQQNDLMAKHDAAQNDWFMKFQRHFFRSLLPQVD